MKARPVLLALPLLAAGLAAACIDHSENPDDQSGGATSRTSSRSSSRPTSRQGPVLGGHGSKGDKPIIEARDPLPDTKEFDALLRKIVVDGKVDYDLVAKERMVIDQYLAGVAAANLQNVDKNRQLAFYINAYNAKVLVMVLKFVIGKGEGGADLAGVLEVEKAAGVKFFETPEVIVGGKLMSLNKLEELGRDLGDPRIHFAVNCASISCPPLMNRVWKAETLDEDLNAATRAYLASPEGLRIDGQQVLVTKLFEWYEKDWGGKDGVLNFLKQYAPDAAKELLDGSTPLGFLEYDWGLNDKK